MTSELAWIASARCGGTRAPGAEKKGLLEGVLQCVLMGRRVLRRVLSRGSKKGLSRRHLEGRSTPFREYDPVGVCAPFYEDGKMAKNRVLGLRIFRAQRALRDILMPRPSPRHPRPPESAGYFQATVCGVTVCPFSRHQGDHKPKCLENKAQTTSKHSCHENALSVTRQTHTCNHPDQGPRRRDIPDPNPGFGYARGALGIGRTRRGSYS